MAEGKRGLRVTHNSEDDLVIQYQTSSEQILKAKDEIEKKLQQENSELITELKKTVEHREQWKRKHEELVTKLQDSEVLNDEVTNLNKRIQEMTE